MTTPSERKKTSRTGRAGTIARGHRKAKRDKPRKFRSDQYWSAGVMQKSDALDIEHGAFAARSAHAVAASLKRSADRSTRRKGTPFRSAMSMLNFFINRAGKNLPPQRRRVLDRAKIELRRLYGRT